MRKLNFALFIVNLFFTVLAAINGESNWAAFQGIVTGMCLVGAFN